MYREDGLSSVDIKSETDTLRPDSPDGEGGLNSEYNTVKFVPPADSNDKLWRNIQ